MSIFFGKNQTAQALAVTIENGREIADKAMQKIRVHRDYSSEPMCDIAVRVEPPNEAPFEAKMRAGISKTFLLITGGRVQVNYDPTHNQQVTLDDDIQAIMVRNPQLSKKEWCLK